VLVAEAVGRALGALGVDVVFGLMGSGNLPCTNALRDAGVRVPRARHECGAICMADGYARVSGGCRRAACTRAGLTNTITGLTEAAKSRTPLIVLAADVPAAALRSNFRIDQTALVESVGAWPSACTAGDRAGRRRARRARARGRAPPVVLMLPLDVQAQETDARGPRSAPSSRRAAPAEESVEPPRT
jgi:thiamine pyrophosphate-dependent acetolactate synthase large subunit-like protein